MDDLKRASTYLGPALFIAGLCGVQELKSLAAAVCVLGTVDSFAMYEDGRMSPQHFVLNVVGHLVIVLAYLRSTTIEWRRVSIAGAVLLAVLGTYTLLLGAWPYHTPRRTMFVCGAVVLATQL